MANVSAARLLLVGNPAGYHVGGHLLRAARGLGLDVEFLDAGAAYRAPAWLARFNWWCRGRRPARLKPFSQDVVQRCQAFKPTCLLTTGIAPLEATALRNPALAGIRRFNYLTDDPWNPAHGAPWFLEALRAYDVVYSTKRAVLPDLRRAGCQRVEYLPFAYAPDVHAPPGSLLPDEARRFECDVIFVGGGDPDRFPLITALVNGGMKVHVYGGYWDRHPATVKAWQGHADLQTLNQATAVARIALCLVRRANRDGHVMRSFEIPAIGACMLVEHSEEHQDMFGPDGKAVVYFRSIEEMLQKARWLLDHEGERQRLRTQVRALITSAPNAYADRLQTMLQA